MNEFFFFFVRFLSLKSCFLFPCNNRGAACYAGRGEMPFRESTKSKEKNPLVSGICSVFNRSAFLARPLVFVC